MHMRFFCVFVQEYIRCPSFVFVIHFTYCFSFLFNRAMDMSVSGRNIKG